MNIIKILTILTVCTLKSPLLATPQDPPARIVSTSLASDEILMELLQGQERSRITAISSRADEPRESFVAEMAKAIKNRVAADPESVAALHPDLIIAASFNRPNFLAQVHKMGAKVLLLEHFDRLADIAANIRSIGAAIQRVEQAERLAKKMEESIARVAEATARVPAIKRPTVTIFSGPLQVMAKETLANEMVEVAGGINTATQAGLRQWPQVSPEALRRWNPRFVIMGAFSKDQDAIYRQLKSLPGWNKLAAVMTGRVLTIDPRALGSTSFHVVDAIRDIHSGLYPR